jgi:hypothetical protein
VRQYGLVRHEPGDPRSWTSDRLRSEQVFPRKPEHLGLFQQLRVGSIRDHEVSDRKGRRRRLQQSLRYHVECGTVFMELCIECWRLYDGVFYQGKIFVAVIDSIGCYVYSLPVERSTDIWPGIGSKTCDARPTESPIKAPCTNPAQLCCVFTPFSPRRGSERSWFLWELLP